MTIAAGCDMFLFTKNLEEDFRYMTEGVKSGIITAERLNEAVTKILAFKAALGLHRDRRLPDIKKVRRIVGCKAHRDLAVRCADDSVTLVKNTQDVLPITPNKYKKVLFYQLDSDAGPMGGFDVSQGANARLLKRLRDEGFDVTEFENKIISGKITPK